MIIGELILDVISLILAAIAIFLGFKSYKISLKNDIRIKYYRFIGQAGVEEMMEKEYVHRISLAMTIFIMAIILGTIFAYLFMLIIKNNIPLI